MAEQLRIFLLRPLQLLFLEPIVFFISLYMSVLYGLLYMFFVAYPIGMSQILLKQRSLTKSQYIKKAKAGLRLPQA